jgi:UPF0755 protein
MLKRLALFALVAVLGLVAAGVWIRHRLTTPYRGFDTGELFVEIPQGASVARIATLLADAGVVSDPLSFRVAARVAGADRHLQAGEYRFTEPASLLQVIERLAGGDVYARPITFPEGLTIKDMAKIVADAGLGSAEEFEQAAADRTRIIDFDPEARSLEGYLFPDTYAFPRNIGAAGVVAAMVDRFKSIVTEDMRRAAAERGMTLREVVTLASLIEKETGAGGERPTVSAVYHNRLKLGMPLQCDPTVIYALMLKGTWRGNLTRQDLQVDSPYNTYRYPGLPAGPIASPGKGAIEAALHPADVPYLYFVSRNDGTHAFASTLDEHNRNVFRWQVQYFRDRRQ